MTGIFKLAMKQVWRDARAGDLLLLALTIVVAVAALSTVSMLADSARQGLERDAGQLLGADLLVETDAAIAEEWLTQAKQQSLQVAQTWQFPSMLSTEEHSLLVSVKAVSTHYPLRGNLRISTDAEQADRAATTIPAPGKLWVDPQVLSGLDVKPGAQLTLGDVNLVLDALITQEPDRGTQFMNLAPRVMFNAADLERTGLVVLGSRVKYALLVAGQPQQVENFRAWLVPRLQPGQKIVTIESGRPEIRQSLERAQQFLTLVGLLATLIAAIALVLGARQFKQRHRKSVVVMRCLGATQKMLVQLFLLEFFIVGLIGSLAGVSLGFIGQRLIARVLDGLSGVSFPSPHPLAMLQAMGLGVFLLLMLATPSLLELNRVAPRQIFKTSAGHWVVPVIRAYLPATVGMLVFLCWVAKDVKLGLLLAAGFAAATAIFSLISYGSVKVLAVWRVRFVTSAALRFGLSCLIRRRHAIVVQISALAVGMMAVLLLTIVRTDLLEGWQRTIPPDAPNRFMINIQPDQLEAVKQDFTQKKHETTALYPMIRGRLIERNGKPLGSVDFDDARAKQLIDREFNLSYASSLPKEAFIEQGRDLNGAADEVSLESGLAKTLRLNLNDELVFDVAGRLVHVHVTSIRKVNWDSMKPNFFAITSPIALEGQPQTWMTAFQLKSDEGVWLQNLLRRYPNVTVFDVGAILAQLRDVLNKVAFAVQGLFGFSVVAGVLVLVMALSSTRDERIREAALLRALGATRDQLSRAQRIEFFITGLIAGLLAAGGATVIAWALSEWVFHFPISFSLLPWLIGVCACVFGSWLIGFLTLGAVLRASPLNVLRQMN